MKSLLLLSTLILLTGCCTDPEFYNCDIEIVTINGDTITIDSAYVEIEGSTDRSPFVDGEDNFLIQKGHAEWNITENKIQSFVITCRRERDSNK